jgi:peptidoglycan/xylan/chitin deacetylase (PgdA/CDA1 family)
VARHLVCLTFDFDAVSSWIYRGMTTPTPISRGEFGVVAAGRILGLLGARRLASTWFVPGHTLDHWPDVCRRVHAEGHEIGHHGYLHEPPAALSRQEEADVLARGTDAIVRVTGAPPRGYRSPAWDLSQHTVELLLERGFVYDSSMMADDYTPYRARRGDLVEPARLAWGEPTSLIEMPVAWSLDDHPHFEFVRREGLLQPGLMATGGVLENWLDEFRYMARTVDWGVLTYTFHPQVIGRGHRMLLLERLVDGLADLGATFVRMDAAAGEFDRRAPFPPTARP